MNPLVFFNLNMLLTFSAVFHYFACLIVFLVRHKENSRHRKIQFAYQWCNHNGDLKCYCTIDHLAIWIAKLLAKSMHEIQYPFLIALFI